MLPNAVIITTQVLFSFLHIIKISGVQNDLSPSSLKGNNNYTVHQTEPLHPNILFKNKHCAERDVFHIKKKSTKKEQQRPV